MQWHNLIVCVLFNITLIPTSPLPSDPHKLLLVVAGQQPGHDPQDRQDEVQ